MTEDSVGATKQKRGGMPKIQDQMMAVSRKSRGFQFTIFFLGGGSKLLVLSLLKFGLTVSPSPF